MYLTDSEEAYWEGGGINEDKDDSIETEKPEHKWQIRFGYAGKSPKDVTTGEIPKAEKLERLKYYRENSTVNKD